MTLPSSSTAGRPMTAAHDELARILDQAAAGSSSLETLPGAAAPEAVPTQPARLDAPATSSSPPMPNSPAMPPAAPNNGGRGDLRGGMEVVIGSQQGTADQDQGAGEKENETQAGETVERSNEQAATDPNQPDWESIEDAYRAGVLSIRQIARTFATPAQGWHALEIAIGRRAKRLRWQRDLSAKIRTATQASLILDGAAPPVGEGEGSDVNARESAIIEGAARLQVEVVRSHRGDISSLRRLQAKLSVKAEILVERMGAEEGKRGRPSKSAISLTLDNLQTAVQTVETLAKTVGRLIPLERQAFNIDGKEGPNSDLSAIESRVARHQKAKGTSSEDDGAETAAAISRGAASGKVARIEDRVRKTAAA